MVQAVEPVKIDTNGKYLVYHIDDGLLQTYKTLRQCYDRPKKEGTLYKLSGKDADSHIYIVPRQYAKHNGFNAETDIAALRVSITLGLDYNSIYDECLFGLGRYGPNPKKYKFGSTESNPTACNLLESPFLRDNNGFKLAEALIELLYTGQLPKKLEKKITEIITSKEPVEYITDVDKAKDAVTKLFE